MEYRLAYEQQPTTVICFSLTDEYLDPDTITRSLGVQPDEAWSKSDQRGRRMAPRRKTGYLDILLDVGVWMLLALLMMNLKISLSNY